MLHKKKLHLSINGFHSMYLPKVCLLRDKNKYLSCDYTLAINDFNTVVENNLPDKKEEESLLISAFLRMKKASEQGSNDASQFLQILTKHIEKAQQGQLNQIDQKELV